MENRDREHLLTLFLSNVRLFRDKPFIFEQHAKMFLSCLRKETAADINAFARAMHSVGLGADSRVAFCGLRPSRAFWTMEWSALSIRAASVIIPEEFPMAEMVGILLETRTKLAIVATAQEAAQLAANVAKLPELTHIISMEEKPISQSAQDNERSFRSVLDYNAFIISGRKHPDHTAEALEAIKSTDTALLFYSRADGEMHKAVRYSHGQLQAHAKVIQQLLGTYHAVNEMDIVLTAPSWDHPIAHIASCYLPVICDAAIQINTGQADFECFDNHPQVVVAETSYIEALKGHIEEYIKHSGTLESLMFRKAVAYGKRKYESADKIGLQGRFFDYLLRVTVVKKVIRLLGGRLRLIIGIDDATSYETQLFFHTFGIDLVEVPSEIF